MSDQKKELTEDIPKLKKTRFPWGLFFTLFVFITLAAFLYLNQHFINSLMSKDDPIIVETQTYEKEFREQRSLLRELLGTLETVKSELLDVKDSQSSLMERLDALENDTSVTVKLEDSQEKAIKGLIDSQEKRLKKFESSIDEKTTLTNAFKELRLSLATAKPFKESFDKFKKLLPKDQHEFLDPIAPYSKIGIPQARYLKNEYKDVEKDLLKIKEPQGSWWNKIVLRFKRLIRISKKGEQRQGIYGETDKLKELLKLNNFEMALKKSLEISIESKSKEAWEQHLKAFVDSQEVIEKLETVVPQSSKGDE